MSVRRQPLELSEDGASGRRIIFISISVGQITTNSTSDSFQIEKKNKKSILGLPTLLLIRGSLLNMLQIYSGICVLNFKHSET